MPAGGIDVPMVAMAPSPVVDVRVNGQGPFRFMLDTGGSGAARTDAALVNRLHLPIVGQAQASDGTGRGVRTLDVVHLDTLTIGGAEFRDLDVPSRDYNAGRPADQAIDGVLGFGLFTDYLLTLDFPAHRIRVVAGTLPPPDGTTIVPLTLDRGIPTLPIRIGDRRIDADIDSGSMGGLSVPMAISKDLPLDGKPTVAGHARTVSNEFDIYDAPLKGSAFLGGFELANPTLSFSEVFRVANVGMRVLRDFVLTIDQKTGRMKLARASGLAGAALKEAALDGIAGEARGGQEMPARAVGVTQP